MNSSTSGERQAEQTAAESGSTTLFEGREADALRAQSESEKFSSSHKQAFILLEEALHITHVRSYQGQFENGIAKGIATITFTASQADQWDSYEG